jgi:hypothetical protein
VLHGYGEEMDLAKVQLPFAGDHWWYPDNSYWRLAAHFHGDDRQLQGGGNMKAGERFRAATGR